MLSKYMRFMKFAPFLGFPVLMFFPSGMALYWVCIAGMHLMMTLITNSRAFRKFAGTKDYLPNTILHREFLRNQELVKQGTLYVNKSILATSQTVPTPVNQTSLNVVAAELEKAFKKPESTETSVKSVEKAPEPKIEKQLDENQLVQGKSKDGRKVKLFTTKPSKSNR